MADESNELELELQIREAAKKRTGEWAICASLIFLGVIWVLLIGTSFDNPQDNQRNLEFVDVVSDIMLYPFLSNPQSTEVEPNDSIDDATVAIFPGSASGTLQQGGDNDYFKFSATQGQILRFRVTLPDSPKINSEAPMLFDLRVLKLDGSPLPGRFTVLIPEDGEYILEVIEKIKNDSAKYVYEINDESAQAAIFPIDLALLVLLTSIMSSFCALISLVADKNNRNTWIVRMLTLGPIIPIFITIVMVMIIVNDYDNNSILQKFIGGETQPIIKE